MIYYVVEYGPPANNTFQIKAADPNLECHLRQIYVHSSRGNENNFKEIQHISAVWTLP